MSNFLKTAMGGKSTVPSAMPAPKPLGPVQQDGNVIPQQAPPTRAPLRDKQASPAAHNTSGIERAMGAAADKLHPTKRS